MGIVSYLSRGAQALEVYERADRLRTEKLRALESKVRIALTSRAGYTQIDPAEALALAEVFALLELLAGRSARATRARTASTAKAPPAARSSQP